MIRQIKYLDTDLICKIITLVSKTPSGKFTETQYIRYLLDYLSSPAIALFGIFNPDLIGILQTEVPHPLMPDVGYIVIAACNIPFHTERKEILRVAENWLASKGAKRWRMETSRNPALWRKLYGLDVVANDYVLGREIK